MWNTELNSAGSQRIHGLLKMSSFCKMVEGNKYYILFYFNIVWMHGYKRCCRWDLNHQPPPVFPFWSVFFPIYGRKYSMKVKLFMENMWEFFLVFYFVPDKVNIPMHAGDLFYVLFLFHTKGNSPLSRKYSSVTLVLPVYPIICGQWKHCPKRTKILPMKFEPLIGI